MDETIAVKNKGGRKTAANPKNVRVTIVVTAAERQDWQQLADGLFDGNLSTMIRQAIKVYASGPKA